MSFQENNVHFIDKYCRAADKNNVRGSELIYDNNLCLDYYVCLASIYKSISSTIYLSPVVCSASKQEYT